MNTATDVSKLQAVILCGGQGTRIRAVAEDRPKPMVEIGERPILWHIMKIYSHHGIRRFILCLGHQGDKIVQYFRNYHAYSHDFTMTVGSPEILRETPQPRGIDSDADEWEITFAHTGPDTMTGGRIKRIERYIDQEHFLCTYGDGVSDVDIPQVYQRHLAQGNTATLVGVHLPTTFGIVESDPQGRITSFREKPTMPGLINGGFFCFSKGIFAHIENDATVLENQPFRRLVELGGIGMVPHSGFWHAMDHYKDYTTLNEMWTTGRAPWKVW